MTTPAAEPNHPRKQRRLIRRLACGSVVAFVIPGLAYLWLAYDYTTKKPAPVVDVYAELNARHAHHDDAEKAWAVYFDTHYNHWYHARSEISSATHAFDDVERERMLEDPAYEPEPSPFTSDHNPFGIPPEHELYARVAEAVDQLQPQIEAVREAARRPVFGTPVVDHPNKQGILEFVPEWYPDPPTVDPLDSLPINEATLIQIGVSRGTAQLLALDARVALDNADLERLANDVRAMLGLARQTAGEPTLIAPLIALATQREAQELVLQALQEHAADQPASGKIQAILALLPDLIRASENPIRVNLDDERLTHLDLIGRIYSDDGTGDGVVTIDGIRTMQGLASQEQSSPTVLALAWPMTRRFVRKSEAIDQLDTLIAAAAQLQSTGPSGIPAYIDAVDRAEAREAGPKRTLLKYSIVAPSWRRAVSSESMARTLLDATIARLALEHHRIDTGRFPDSLDQLVPTYLDRLPDDPFDPGQPLKYLLIEGVPHLYSVGADGDDDHAARPDDGKPPERAHDFERRFPHPDHPTDPAPDADWVICPPV